MDLTVKLYDSEGKEIFLNPGHAFLIGKESFTQIPMYSTEQQNHQEKLIYRPPGKEEFPLICEWGCTGDVTFPASDDRLLKWADQEFIKSIKRANEKIHDGDAGNP